MPSRYLVIESFLLLVVILLEWVGAWGAGGRVVLVQIIFLLSAVVDSPSTSPPASSPTVDKGCAGMSAAGVGRRWVAPRISFGALPSPRHSATTWTTDDRFFYVYGGSVVNPEPFEQQSVYRLDTRPLDLFLSPHLTHAVRLQAP